MNVPSRYAFRTRCDAIPLYAASRAQVGFVPATVVMPGSGADGVHQPVGLETVRKLSKAAIARAVVHQIGAILMFAALPSPYTHRYTKCTPPPRCGLQVARLVGWEITGRRLINSILF